MRTIFASALIASAYASKVHPFFAESNFMCEMCQDTVVYASKGMTEEIESLYKLFPVLEEKISAFSGHEELINLADALGTCQNLMLCEKESIADMLYSEQPKDLSSIVEYVNNHPNATWTAGINKKFEGASHREIRKLMGTVVDPKWRINGHIKESASV